MYRLGKKSTPIMVFLAVWIAASCSKGPRAAFEGSGTLEATEILLSAKTAGTVMEHIGGSFYHMIITGYNFGFLDVSLLVV